MKKISAKERVKAQPKPRLDDRTPIGTRLEREYKGKKYEVLVTEAGFELDGVTHLSLSGAAKAIVGSQRPLSGHQFFGLWRAKPSQEPVGGAQLAQDAPEPQETHKAAKKGKKRKGAKKVAE